MGLRGMVATSQPLAVLAGVRALEPGGNAMDAALAAAGVMTVTEPSMCGPGGDLFAIVLRDGEEPRALNASGRAPRKPDAPGPEEFGPRSVTVPGCVSGWTELAALSRHGLEAALQPAIALADAGFVIGPKTELLWLSDLPDLEGEAAAHFALRRPFRNADIARALREAAAGTFYTGAVADAIASVSWLDGDDLASHRPDWVEPRRFSYRDHVLLELPPNSQGSIAGWALESLAAPGPAAMIDALAAAYERGYATIGDTSYLCAADGEGMGVSLIQSNSYGFGSRVLVPGFGFVLQNRAAGFLGPAGRQHPFAPGRRPFHTLMPGALLEAGGRWCAVLGVLGGQFQPQGHVQVVSNLLDRGLDPQAALDAPRFRLEEDGSVSLEPPLADLAESLDRPARVVDEQDNYGTGQVIWRDAHGVLSGGSEPRRDGLALGL
jgi:gamma-glutamyltranspeptidase / glutathione hydrolase